MSMFEWLNGKLFQISLKYSTLLFRLNGTSTEITRITRKNNVKPLHSEFH